MRILLVEDDPQIGAAIVSALDDAGMAAGWVTDGNAALSSVEAGSFELILLDIGLPKKDGLSVLRSLRQNHISIPVIMITARDRVQDRIASLDLGADDYLVKPFMIDELMARIRAVICRHAGGALPNLSNKDFTIEPVSKSTSYRQLPLELSAKEYRFLHSLFLAPGRIYSRDELEEKVYG
ncbi:MAG: two-component system OmpR family response regulator [Porticoccaceae bacterium]|jgi:two-component system OmpR family response regulator